VRFAGKPAGSVSLDILALLHKSDVDMARVCVSFGLGRWGWGRARKRELELKETIRPRNTKSPGKHPPGLPLKHYLMQLSLLNRLRFARRFTNKQLPRTTNLLFRIGDHFVPLRDPAHRPSHCKHAREHSSRNTQR